MEKFKFDSASILEGVHCNDCGWPIIDVCCNWEYSKGWDWWYYCSNKGCKNHLGEGIFQNTPDWIIKD